MAAADDMVRVTANCGLDWTGPGHAWTGWISDRHAYAHDKGHKGLPACCDGLTVTSVELDSRVGEHDQDWAGRGFTRPGPEPAREHRGSLPRRLAEWIARLQRQLSGRLFTEEDTVAREHGWEISKTTRRFGFGVRIYHDPRFGSHAAAGRQGLQGTGEEGR